MNNILTKITGWALIIGAVLVNFPYYLLISNFNYPDILREPPEKILTQFYYGGNELIFQWLAFAWVGIPILIGIILLHKVLKEKSPYLSYLGLVFGIFSIVFQLVGLLRWVFVVPVLASQFVNPATSEVTKAAVIVAFQTIHQYGGVLIGEHLGQIFTIIWTVLISVTMFRSPIFRKWLGWFGIVSSVIYLFAQTELMQTVIPDFFVIPEAGFTGSVLWLIWMIIMGIYLIRFKVAVS